MEEKKLLEYLEAPLNKWKFGGDDSYYSNMRDSMLHSLKLKLPEDVKNCYCGKIIDINYYVYNSDTKTIKILCNNCCNRFIPSHMTKLRKFVGSDFKDWEYCGGTTSGCPSFESAKSEDIFEKYFGDSMLFPEYKDKCGCGHDIVRNEYIINKKTKELKILGSTCITHWTERNKFKNCKLCGLITNTKSGVCKSCKTVRVDCPCGGHYTGNPTRHLNTKKHKRYIESLN